MRSTNAPAPLPNPDPKAKRRAAIETGFGMFQGRLSSEAFLADKHAEAKRELEKAASEIRQKESAS